MGAQMCLCGQVVEPLLETAEVQTSSVEVSSSPVLLGSVQKMGEMKTPEKEAALWPTPKEEHATAPVLEFQEPVLSSQDFSNASRPEPNVDDDRPPIITDSEARAVPDEMEQLIAAVKQGRYIAALRELKTLKDEEAAMKVLDSSSLERMKRIEGRYEAGMKLIQGKPSDFKVSEENTKLNLSWGMKLEGDRLTLMQETKLPSLSLVDCCVLEFERDLENHLSDDDIKATMLSLPHAHECTWHRLSHIKDVGSKTDDVLVESALDALDEPCKSVIGMRYSPSAYDSAAKVDPSGNPIPPTEKGRERSPYQFFFTKLTPSHNGVVRTETSEAQIPGTVAKILGLMPGFVLKKLFRKTVENQAKYAVEFAQKRRAVIEERMHAAPRSEFYQQIRSHEASMAQ